MICLRMNKNNRDEIGSFRSHVPGRDEAVSFCHVSGEDDLMPRMAVRDVEHSHETIINVLTVHPEFMHIETLIIYAERCDRRPSPSTCR